MPLTEAQIAREVWRPVVGYEGAYEVSDVGRVRRRGRILRPYPNGKNGYPTVTLCPERKKHHVHFLVLTAFVCARPEGLQARHLDGDHLNNRLSNLKWGTHRENWDDRRRHGTGLLLSDDVVSEVRRMLRGGAGYVHIAKRFRISTKTIAKIKFGRHPYQRAQWSGFSPSGLWLDW